MQMLSEWDGAKTKDILRETMVYAAGNNTWKIDLYVAGVIIDTKTYTGIAEAEVRTKAKLFTEGVEI